MQKGTSLQRFIATIYRRQIRFAVMAALVLAAVGAFFATTPTQAQQRECRNLLRIEACADVVVDHGGGNFTMAGDVVLRHLGDQQPLVRIAANTDDDFALLADVDDAMQQGRLSYTRLPSGKNEIIIYGDIQFLQGPEAQRSLIRTYHLPTLGDGTAHGIVMLDEETELLYLPSETEWRNYYTRTFNRTVPRLAGITLPMLDNLNLGWYNAVATQQDRDQLNAFLSFTLREMQVGLPLANMPLIDIEGAPGPMSAYFTLLLKDDGTLRSRMDQQKIAIAGFKATIKGAQLLDLPATRTNASGNLLADADVNQTRTSKGIQFDAIEFLREDNPDLPNLDPNDPKVVFTLENLIYHEGRFSIKAGTRLRDWRVGNAFQLTDQNIAVSVNQLTGQFELLLNSTLTFAGNENAVSDTTRYPVAITIGAQQQGERVLPLFRGTLGAAQPNLGIGMLRIKPTTVGLEFNPARNFYGLTADKVTLQWNSQGGSSSGPSLDGFRLGIDKDKNLVFNLGAGGEIDLPAFRSSVFTGSLKGSFSAKDGVLAGTFKGKLNVAIPGNSGVAPEASLSLRRGTNVRSSCPTDSTPATCQPSFELKLSAFELKLAGFSLALANPQGLDGGGVMASEVTLKLPTSLSSVGGSSVQVRGLRIAGNGNVSLDGGGFALPPIRAGGYEFTSVKGFFAKSATGYEFRAGATLPLPGLNSSSKQIKADLTLRTRADGSFLGAGVKLDFRTNSSGIPIGTTGMELTQLGGSFDTGSGTTRIGVTMQATSTKRIGTTPLATLAGQAQLQVRPFQLTANARLTLLVVQVAEASVGIGHQQGFNGGDGFFAQLTIDVRVARGDFLVRMGNLTLSNGTRRFSVAISATVDVGIRKHQFARYVPPFDLNVSRLRVQGGDFQVRGGSEALGVIGSASCCWGTLSASFFIDLRTGGLSMIDPDNYRLIGAAQVRSNAAAGVAGYQVAPVALSQIAATTGVVPPRFASSADPNRPLLDDLALVSQVRIPVTVEQAGTVLFGISAPSRTTTPVLTVEGPNQQRYISMLLNNSDTAPAIFIEEGNATDGYDWAIVVRNAPAGQYTLIVDDAPAQYEQISYRVNQAPTLTDVAFTCFNPQTENETLLVATLCDDAQAGDGVQVRFRATDADGPEATAAVGYVPVQEDGSVAEEALVRLVQENLPVNGQLQTVRISTQGIPSGRYRIVVTVQDGANAPVVAQSPQVVTVGDFQPPDAPAFVLADSGPGAVLVRWLPSPWMDVAGYEVGFGDTNDPAAFRYTRDLGALGPDDLDAEGYFSATLWGIAENATVYVSVRLYDQDGNMSAWATPQLGSAWALAPNGQSPLPGGVALPTTSVQVLFGSPLVAGTLNQRLELRDGNGQIVAGRATLITDPMTGHLFGMRFVPTAPLTVGQTYEVLLKVGVLSEDDRGMPDDYRWLFTVVDPASAEAAAVVPPEPVGALTPPAEGGVPGQLPGGDPTDPTDPTPAGTRIFLPLLSR
jgi:hypothetical protein